QAEQCAILRPATANLTAQQFVAIGQAKRLDFRADVVDFQHGRLRLRLANEAAGAAASFYESGFCQLRQSLVHGHSRAAILGGQLMFEGNAMAGRPDARQYALADIGENAPMQRFPFRPIRCVCGHGCLCLTGQFVDNSCMVARNRDSTTWRRICRPPSTSFLPWAHTQSTAAAPAKIQQSSIESPDLPLRVGWLGSKLIRSAAAPSFMPH